MTLVHAGMIVQANKKEASPRVIPLGAIESVEFVNTTLVKRGFLRLVLRGRTGYEKDPLEDVNAYMLKGMKKDAAGERFADAIRSAIVGVEPIEGYGAAGTPEETRRGALGRAQDRHAAAKQALADLKERTANSFGKFWLDGDTLYYGEDEYPIAGAKATIESAGIARSRLTATRVVGGALLFGGVGAIVGASARKDKSTIFITVELADGSVAVDEVPASREADARKFAARITNAGVGGTANVPAEEPAVQSPDGLEQLRKLAELRDAGILTDDEFNSKKAALLDKI